MDVVGLPHQLLAEDSALSSSFVKPLDARIGGLLAKRETDEAHRSQPVLRANKHAASAGSVNGLVAATVKQAYRRPGYGDTDV